jgi:hypothetical protein
MPNTRAEGREDFGFADQVPLNAIQRTPDLCKSCDIAKGGMVLGMEPVGSAALDVRPFQRLSTSKAIVLFLDRAGMSPSLLKTRKPC